MNTRHVHSRRLLPALAMLVTLALLLRCASSEEAEDDALSAQDCGCCDETVVVQDGDTVTFYAGLLSTRFETLEDLKKVVTIEYTGDPSDSTDGGRTVIIEHCSHGVKVVSVLSSGVSEKEIRSAHLTGFTDIAGVVLREPFLLWHKDDLVRFYLLSRRKHDHFGPGDVAFYDFAELMVEHIRPQDLQHIRSEDLTDKGYLNTFNHITAQAFVTSIFSEDLAEFGADIHERYNMPELISGDFSPEQMTDPNQNPMDNYVDMVNNEWGQELGKVLRKKYNLDRSTVWTPELLASYLNDIQDYFSWSFQIGFIPFSPDDPEVIRFSDKINEVLGEVDKSVVD